MNSKLRNQSATQVPVKDGWTRDFQNYDDLIYTVFTYLKSNPVENREELNLQALLNKPENRIDLKKYQQYCIENNINGEGSFYLLKKGKKMGGTKQREISIRNNQIVQINAKKNTEKILGTIKSMKKTSENNLTKSMKATTAQKHYLEANLIQANNQERIVTLIFEEQNYLQRVLDSSKTNNSSNKEQLKAYFKSAINLYNKELFRSFRLLLGDHYNGQIEKAQTEQKRLIQINQSAIGLFTNYDQEQIKQLIGTWKTQARQIKQQFDDADIDKQREQQDKLNRRKNLFQKTTMITNYDRLAVSKSIQPALETAYQKQNEEDEEKRRLDELAFLEEQKKRKRAKANPKVVDKFTEFSFLRLLLPESLHMTRPIIEVTYVATSSDDADKKQPRNINDVEYPIEQSTIDDYGEKCLTQQYFFARMVSKYNGKNYLWQLRHRINHELINKFSKIVLEQPTLRILDINRSKNDFLRIKIQESHQRKGGFDHPVFEKTVYIKDIANEDSHNRELWLDLNQSFGAGSLGKHVALNPQQRILIELDVFSSEFSHRVEKSTNGFKFYHKEFLEDDNARMSDPIYSVFLPNILPNPYSLQYFLNKLTPERSTNYKSIELLSFLLDSAAPNKESEVQSKQLMIDFRRVFFDSVSMHLSSSYFDYLDQGNECQAQIMSKISEAKDPNNRWFICEIANNINKFRKELDIKDLRTMVQAGIPFNYRPLYWLNSLQVQTHLKDDQELLKRTQKDPTSLVEGFEFFLNQSRSDQGNVERFLESDQRKLFLGKQRSDNLEKILLAFGTFLKLHRVMDPSEEDEARSILYRFVECVFVSLQVNSSHSYSQFDFKEVGGCRRLRSKEDLPTDDETELTRLRNEQQIAETFWICVGLYNLKYKAMMSINNEHGIDVLKEKLARGVLSYQMLLSEEAKQIIDRNSLEDSVFICWVEAYLNLFDRYISSPAALARTLDVLIFEFESNYLDGFDTAVSAVFAELLNQINLSAVYQLATLREAFSIQSIIIPTNFIEKIYENIAILTESQLSPALIKKTVQFLRFEVFVEMLYPTTLGEFKVAEKTRADMFNPLYRSRYQFDDLPPEEHNDEGMYASQTYMPYLNQSVKTFNDIGAATTENDIHTIGTKKTKVLTTTYHIDRRHFIDQDQDQYKGVMNYTTKQSVQNTKAFIPSAHKD